MGRAPCCEKMGLKKGPWTPDEDRILINYISVHGHSNWRALPKLAGLLRCGKSCRLRWTNYLRPDIKRGNFTPEEEETIIKLHEMLGNRWSAIAAKLPGRTDNEIKNVWHTHLKKRLPNLNPGSTHTEPVVNKRARKSKSAQRRESSKKLELNEHVKCVESKLDKSDNNGDININYSNNEDNEKQEPCASSSEMSTVTSSSSSSGSQNDNREGYIGDLTDINDDFWMEVLSVEDTAMSTQDNLSGVSGYGSNISSDHLMTTESMFKIEDGVDGAEMDVFWHNLLMPTSNDLLEFSEIVL